MSPDFLWALSGLLASMSLHLGFVAVLVVEISMKLTAIRHQEPLISGVEKSGFNIQGGTKKGPAYLIANILKTP